MAEPKVFLRASNGHLYAVTLDEKGKVASLVNQTTQQNIPLNSRTARKFPKGFEEVKKCFNPNVWGVAT